MILLCASPPPPPPPQSLQISLKISKEQPETIDRKRQTINLMATRKDTKPKQ